jgi:hypothetical protein
MHLGAYIFVTPVAMVIACLTVTAKYRLSQEEANARDEAKKYMSIILSNRNATKRVKDKIFDLKEFLDSENSEDEE